MLLTSHENAINLKFLENNLKTLGLFEKLLENQPQTYLNNLLIIQINS